MGIFALSTLLVAGAGVYLFSKVFPNFHPGNKKVQADLKSMKEELAPEVPTLISLKAKDMELLASEEEERSTKKGLTKRIRGKLTTIFHEPVVLYSYKRYLSSSGKDALLFGKTADHDYFFWIKAKGAKLVIDNNLVGTLENGDVLIGSNTKRMIARINRDEEEYMSVLIQGKEVGSIAKPPVGAQTSLSTRAFGYVKNDLSTEEKAILMALTIFELVMRKVD